MPDSPLNEEQINKINEISKLPSDIQKEELPKFLETLNEEQIEFLKKQQGQTQCLFCTLAEGGMDSYKVYEDELIMGVLDINPANEGHVIVFPKKHNQFLGELNDEINGHLFNVVNRISSKLVEILKSEGVNIYVANGHGAGQSVPHISVHVIPRFKDDGINFGWNARKIDEKSFGKVAEKLKISKIGKKREKIKSKPIKLNKLHFQRIP
jgi:histidine triad (HIT) family protein